MTTEHNIAEVREYVPEFAARYSLSEELLHDALTLLPIDVYGENTYIRERPAAQRNLEMERERSQRDIVLVARRDSSRPRH
ncbi:MAG TPA: hypothetical protein VJZ00_08195 [Thermoanaerobaculia bacterium]|nr:hypothetical protein [Thermoanaerobaculia bacterium]